MTRMNTFRIASVVCALGLSACGQDAVAKVDAAVIVDSEVIIDAAVDAGPPTFELNAASTPAAISCGTDSCELHLDGGSEFCCRYETGEPMCAAGFGCTNSPAMGAVGQADCDGPEDCGSTTAQCCVSSDGTAMCIGNGSTPCSRVGPYQTLCHSAADCAVINRTHCCAEAGADVGICSANPCV